MKVTYIDHSGFLVEMQNCYLLFDYYQGELPEKNPEKELFIFVSHQHHDHFNPVIFDWQKTHSRVRYILSKDIRLRAEQKEALGEDLLIVGREKEYDLTTQNGEKMHIATLKSTDEGVAFLLCLEEKTIYHGGDLNAWVWEGETKAYNNNMMANYLREMNKLQGMHIDLAFVPLDPRLEKDYCVGMEIFLEKTDADLVYPMHMWGDHSVIDRFLAEEKHQKWKDRIQRTF